MRPRMNFATVLGACFVMAALVAPSGEVSAQKTCTYCSYFMGRPFVQFTHLHVRGRGLLGMQRHSRRPYWGATPFRMRVNVATDTTSAKRASLRRRSL